MITRTTITKIIHNTSAPLRESSWLFSKADLAARVSVCGGCIRAFRWSRGSFWFRCRSVPPHSGLDIPLLFSSPSSPLSFTTLPRFPFATRKNLYKYLCFFLFFRSAIPWRVSKRLAVSIPISFPLTIPYLPSSSIITTSWIHSLFRLHEDLEPGTLFSPCTI